jgi:hypothetical protein
VIVGAVVALWLVASPSALAQPSFSSSNPGIKGARPCGGGGSDFNGDSHLDIATTNEGVPIFLSGDGTDVLLGDCNGNFPGDNEFPGHRGPQSVAVGDFNAQSANGSPSPILRSGRGATRSATTPATARAEKAAARSWFPGFRAEPVGD